MKELRRMGRESAPKLLNSLEQKEKREEQLTAPDDIMSKESRSQGVASKSGAGRLLNS